MKDIKFCKDCDHFDGSKLCSQDKEIAPVDARENRDRFYGKCGEDAAFFTPRYKTFVDWPKSKMPDPWIDVQHAINSLQDESYDLSEELKPLKEEREKLLEQVERINDEIKRVSEKKWWAL